jgi:hypothetical protein
MADKKFEDEQLRAFTERVQSSLMFQCACCYERRASATDIGRVALYRAKSRMIGNQIEDKAAPYVICKKCLDTPNDARDRRVLECLAGHGLFDR